ncbi:MAG: hypothetical protein Q8O56_09455 [Solirubrobacteraceae bacterium]|nr:hypothetical protein [Solirubrobacteraceae bacterium]
MPERGPGTVASGRADAPAPQAREPALCRSAPRVRVTGRVAAPDSGELSGLVRSPSRRDVLWTHNDSGNGARLIAVTPAGRTVADVVVEGAENVDWEDIATGAGRSLLIGDIGDNLARRDSVVVYRVLEPRITAPAATGVAVAARYELRYPDGARDAEALLFDRATATVVIVTKSLGGESGVYVAREPSARRVTVLRRTGTISLGALQAVTAGDVSGDGRTIALRTYDRAYVWHRRSGESVAAALRRAPCAVDADLLREGQGEALALDGDGRAFHTVPEDSRAAIRRYEARGGAS